MCCTVFSAPIDAAELRRFVSAKDFQLRGDEGRNSRARGENAKRPGGKPGRSHWGPNGPPDQYQTRQELNT
jgi:hypothetical protein